MTQTYNQRWYERNKEANLKKKATKYQTDPAYREQVKARAKARREQPTEVKKEGFDTTMVAAAEQIGVSIWAMREWRKKEYFPLPYKFGGKLWLRPHQIVELAKLKAFFDLQGNRVTDRKKPLLTALINEIAENWN